MLAACHALLISHYMYINHAKSVINTDTKVGFFLFMPAFKLLEKGDIRQNTNISQTCSVNTLTHCTAQITHLGILGVLRTQHLETLAVRLVLMAVVVAEH